MCRQSRSLVVDGPTSWTTWRHHMHSLYFCCCYRCSSWLVFCFCEDAKWCTLFSIMNKLLSCSHCLYRTNKMTSFVFICLAKKYWNLFTLLCTFTPPLFSPEVDNWPIDSPPSCLGSHDLRIACLNTYYNMKAISPHYNITDHVSDKVMVIAICIGMIDKWIQ